MHLGGEAFKDVLKGIESAQEESVTGGVSLSRKKRSTKKETIHKRNKAIYLLHGHNLELGSREKRKENVMSLSDVAVNGDLNTTTDSIGNDIVANGDLNSTIEKLKHQTELSSDRHLPIVIGQDSHLNNDGVNINNQFVGEEISLLSVKAQASFDSARGPETPSKTVKLPSSSRIKDNNIGHEPDVPVETDDPKVKVNNVKDDKTTFTTAIVPTSKANKTSVLGKEKLSKNTNREPSMEQDVPTKKIIKNSALGDGRAYNYEEDVNVLLSRQKRQGNGKFDMSFVLPKSVMCTSI